MEEIAGYRKLIVWQKADELVLLIYRITAKFPKSEIFCITSQLRRAGLSIPTNIVEGYAKNNRNEFRRYLSIALGSLAEVKYLLTVASRLDYLPIKEYNNLFKLAEITGQLLWKLYKSIK